MRQEKRHFHSARLRRAEAQTWNIQSECAPGPGASAGAESLTAWPRQGSDSEGTRRGSESPRPQLHRRPARGLRREKARLCQRREPVPARRSGSTDLIWNIRTRKRLPSLRHGPVPLLSLDHSLAAQQEFKITGHNFNEYGRRYFKIGNVCSSTGCYGIFQGKPHLSTRPRLCAGSRTVRSLPMRKLQFWAFLS